MGWAVTLGAVVAAGLLVASCADPTVGSGVVGSGTPGTATVGVSTATAGTGTVSPGTSAPPTTLPSSTTSGPSPTPTPPPLLPASGTGAYGYVSAGPTCPVEKKDEPCPPRAVSETVTARDASGGTVATTHSDSHGRYGLDLAPGSYTLVVVTTSGWPRCPDTAVTVRPGSPTRADISCDTGIR